MQLKRVFDLVLAGLAVILLAPVGAICAALVGLTSPGPVLFRQRRLGLRGAPFWLLKFRTMQDNCPFLSNADGSAYTGQDDPRVTTAGRFLRSTSLDELPQLLNVIRGEMSLVGPRPDQAEQLRFYSGAERLKLEVKPGLTG